MVYAFILPSILYMEVLLRFRTNSYWQGFPYSLFSSLLAGLSVTIILSIIDRPAVVRKLAGLLLFLLGFVFALNNAIFATFKVFMPFSTIISEAGNVIRNFSGLLFTSILHTLPMTLLFFVPFILFVLLTSRRLSACLRRVLPSPLRTERYKLTRFGRIAVLIILIILTTFGQALTLYISDDNRAAYRSEYSFDNACRRLGLLPGLSLELWYSAFGYPYDNTGFLHVETPEFPDIADLVTPAPSPAPAANSPSGTEAPDITPTPEPTPVVYGYNMLDIDFETLIQNEENADIVEVHKYVASLPPSVQNEYTGLFEGKNLIIICAETFTQQVIDPVMTPTLYRLSKNGIRFTDFYQPFWGGNTSGGEFAILTGFPPLQSTESIHVAVKQNTDYTIGNRLMQLGYHSAAYHNGTHTYYRRNESHTKLGYETFCAFGSGMDEHVQDVFPASDLEMMEFSVPKYIDNQPFSVYYMTISGHSPYSRGGNAMTAKNWDAFPEEFSQMYDVLRGYMAANLELEYALAYLVSSLEDAGIADDTVIVIAPDHYPYSLQNAGAWNYDRDYLDILLQKTVSTPEDRDRNALILWSGCLENEHKNMATEINLPVFTLDILPTLLNLFGLEYDSRMFVGRDVFSDAAALVFWPDRSYKTEAGFYNAETDVFTPSDDKLDIPDDYTGNIRSIVNNKFSYTGSVFKHDYFATLLNR